MTGTQGFDLETHSGATFCLGEFDPKLVVIDDIARSLAMQCRYNGHCSRFYSVAEHSVLASYWMDRNGYNGRMQLLALMHDAAEAYVGDLIQPVKALLPGFKIIEHRVQQAIWEAFDIAPPEATECLLVKRADLVLLASEAECLMKSGGRGWDIPQSPDPAVRFRWWQPEQAKEMFEERFNVLAQPETLKAKP